MVWAANASSITSLVVPTSRNLALAPPGVNKFSGLGYANVRQKWLPFLGTRRLLQARRVAGRLCSAQEFTGSGKPFILSAIDIGNAAVRNSSNRPAWPWRTNQIKLGMFRASS